MHTYLHENMHSAESITLGNGQAAVYSAPSPNKNHDQNEDACAVISIDKSAQVLAVADGVGGHRGGQEASTQAITSICDHLGVNAAPDPGNLREPILDAIEQCNQKLLDSGLGSATTLVTAEIQDRKVRPYYIGDSTILLAGQRGVMKFQSIAQSPMGYALESGLIEEEDSLLNENSHWVSNLIGMTEMHMTVGPWISLAPRDTLLLCSDGLTDNIAIDEIIHIIRVGPLKDAAEHLLQQCKKNMLEEHGHVDDLTFILYRPIQ